jgi:hypothetical protein
MKNYYAKQFQVGSEIEAKLITKPDEFIGH